MSQQLQVGRPSNSLHFIVGEMSGKLDQVLLMLARVDKLEDRVGSLERLKWKVVGGVSLIVFTSGIAEVWFNVKR